MHSYYDVKSENCNHENGQVNTIMFLLARGEIQGSIIYSLVYLTTKTREKFFKDCKGMHATSGCMQYWGGGVLQCSTGTWLPLGNLSHRNTSSIVGSHLSFSSFRGNEM